MADLPLLKYFGARGRAQFIRYFLAARGVDHTEERVTIDLTAWPPVKADRSFSGPFQKLPVLHWQGRVVAETLVIQAFLHRVLGDEALLSEDDNLRHSMLVSSLYGDAMMPVGIMLWADFAFAGADPQKHARATFDRLRGHFSILERTLGEWDWLVRRDERPVLLADCLLWEELDVVGHVFGPAWVLDEWPGLAQFYRTFAARATCERILAAYPSQITARPGEADAIVRIRGFVAPQ